MIRRAFGIDPAMLAGQPLAALVNIELMFTLK
jgi:hypothetical protein